MLTLKDLALSEKEFFTPAEVSGVLGCDPQSIRVTARQKPDMIQFPFIFAGNRMKIPKRPFLRFMGVDPDRPETPCT